VRIGWLILGFLVASQEKPFPFLSGLDGVGSFFSRPPRSTIFAASVDFGSDLIFFRSALFASERMIARLRPPSEGTPCRFASLALLDRRLDDFSPLRVFSR